MSLIRCLGPLRLPLAYRRFMKAELKMYREKRTHSDDPFNVWEQDALEPAWENRQEGEYFSNDFTKEHYITEDGPCIEIPKPAKCPALEAILGQFYQGRQTHVLMTLVSTDLHRDLYDEQLDTSLIIPYELSPLHLLHVDGEESVLLPHHLYAFNQKREHALLYGTETIDENLGSRPASFLSVSFSKKEGRARK